jgi:hypothetical protein
LPRGILPDAGLQNLAEGYVLDLRGIDLRALDRGGKRSRAERRGGEWSERSPKLPERRASHSDYNGFGVHILHDAAISRQGFKGLGVRQTLVPQRGLRRERH